MGWFKDHFTSKEEEKAYDDAVDKVKKLSAANTSNKAAMMANQGAAAVGNTSAQTAASAAKSAGMNAEAADAVGANIGNTATQNAFNNEYNKAVEANQQEIAEAEQAANEANKRRAEKKGALSKLGGIAGTVAGTIGGAALGSLAGPVGLMIGAGLGGGLGGGLGSMGGNALSDENCKDKWLIDSIAKHRKSLLKNDRLRNREYD
jgi:hypothetical protein